MPQPLRNCSHQVKPKELRRERIRKGRAPAGFASKPLQECSFKNLETLLLEPLKTMKSSPIKTMKTCFSHCVAFGTPKNTQAIRKHSQKTADALLLEPTKKNKRKHTQATAKLQPPGKAEEKGDWPSQPAQNNKLRYKNTSRTKHRIRAKSCSKRCFWNP